ncbi:GNAT family N-acetyltransferase [Microlunatus parietis]|uniref:Ribosomal protein S18 acetylase RimI-like enzyme n=1 Tax=Microlunatus parietis TaxID=682979 RepID=A0A7Y9IEU3_9ACTN|nr:GNAT family N-acetyltransferase [Microlunatus parietis]NYE75321.1 ribosomal protein S18 acetylase RimI-like enzyme [Microlunatus parietis]
MIDIVPARSLGDDAARIVSEIFVDGFGQHFTAFTKDPGRLVGAFAHTFVLDLFYVATLDGEPAGIAACTDGVQGCVHSDAATMRQHLGLIRGMFAHWVFASQFSEPIKDPRPGQGSIEFVATAARHRGRGVASALLRWLHTLPQYDSFVLAEVADTNTGALSVYRRLGYVAYDRKPVRHGRFSGINAYVSLRYAKDSPAAPLGGGPVAR